MNRIGIVLTLLLLAYSGQIQAKTFVLRDGDRVVFLGNAFFERALPFGHLETTLTLRWPDQNLTFRNLGWDGDTVYGHARAGGRRRAVFGDAEEGFQRMIAHLKSLNPTVIFVAYGLNESFDGEQGLGKFRNGLRRLTSELPATTRYVFISPIAIEHHVDGNAPSNVDKQLGEHVRIRNAMLQKYCNVIADFARQHGHRYVDLSQETTSKSSAVTNDSLHPDAEGYSVLAESIAGGLDMPPPKIDLSSDTAEKLRAAIVKKNTLYYHRWRPRNDAFVYGERKSEQVIAQQEPEQFEPFIAEQEKHIRDMVEEIGGAK